MDRVHATLRVEDQAKCRPSVTRQASHHVALIAATGRTTLYASLTTDGSAVVDVVRDGYLVWQYVVPAEEESLFGR